MQNAPVQGTRGVSGRNAKASQSLPRSPAWVAGQCFPDLQLCCTSHSDQRSWVERDWVAAEMLDGRPLEYPTQA